jgi:hypothetical protein
MSAARGAWLALAIAAIGWILLEGIDIDRLTLWRNCLDLASDYLSPIKTSQKKGSTLRNHEMRSLACISRRQALGSASAAKRRPPVGPGRSPKVTGSQPPAAGRAKSTT